jgi:hypothetical protein
LLDVGISGQQDYVMIGLAHAAEDDERGIGVRKFFDERDRHRDTRGRVARSRRLSGCGVGTNHQSHE